MQLMVCTVSCIILLPQLSRCAQTNSAAEASCNGTREHRREDSRESNSTSCSVAFLGSSYELKPHSLGLLHFSRPPSHEGGHHCLRGFCAPSRSALFPLPGARRDSPFRWAGSVVRPGLRGKTRGTLATRGRPATSFAELLLVFVFDLASRFYLVE